MRNKNTDHFAEVDGIRYYTTVGLMTVLKLRRTSLWRQVKAGNIQVALKHPIGNLFALDTPAKWKSNIKGAN